MGGLVGKAAAYRFLDTFVLIFPFYTVMFTEHGMNAAQIGVALAAWSLTGVALEIPTGALADRVSRRWLLFAAQVFRGAGFLVWALFPGFWGYLIGFVLWGVKSALVSGTFEALLYDELRDEGRQQDYARAIGHAQTGRFAGLMAAALIASAVAGIGNYALTLISSASSLLGAASALLDIAHGLLVTSEASMGEFAKMKDAVLASFDALDLDKQREIVRALLYIEVRSGRDLSRVWIEHKLATHLNPDAQEEDYDAE